MTAKDLQAHLRCLGNPQDAVRLAGFFKTGPGQYAEGDVFIGVRVPVIRKVANDFQGLPLSEVKCLLHSPVHEERLAALAILVMKATKADTPVRKAIYDLYLANTEFINNWDLVDLSAPQLVELTWTIGAANRSTGLPSRRGPGIAASASWRPSTSFGKRTLWIR